MDKLPAFPLAGHQIGVLELHEMKGKSRGRYGQRRADFAYGHTGWSGLHKKAEDRKTRVLGKRGQRIDGFI